ncbi:MAG TPA: serine/threonine protein kinase, partial [Candidatus Latescibacteria bacterium]|nr:serine/threonine protein kinase [Candidatus Latescibacterota bacterium]
MRTKSLGFALLFATIALRGAANADDSFRTLTGLESSASSVAITPDGQNVAAGIAGTVKVWRISDGALLSTLGQIGTEPVYGVAVTSDGGRVVAGDNGKRIRVWQLSDGALLRTIATGVIPMALALTPDGEAVVAGCDDYKIRVWRLSDGQLIRTFVEQHTSVVKGVAVTPDGQTVVSGSLDETIKVWRLSDG